MKFNYLKGLIIGALLCSLCINAKPHNVYPGVGPAIIPEHKRIRYRCSSTYIISITSSCVENSYGQITEIVLKKDVQISTGFFSYLKALEKVIITGKQHYITQSNLVEMASIKTLKEVYFESKSFATSSQYDMTVFEQANNLSTLQIGQTDYYGLISQQQEMQYSCSSTYILSISVGCVQNSFGQITEIILKENAQIEKGFFACLVALEKITICGTQQYITQKSLVELSAIKTLKEVYFESKEFATSEYNMTVFEQTSSLSTLKIGQTNYYDVIAQKQEVQYSCSSSYIMSISSSCVENCFGQITELVINENVQIQQGFFNVLTALEKITISGTQQYITQESLVELSAIKTLKEVYFESKAFATSEYNLTIFEHCSNLSTLIIGKTTYFDRRISSKILTYEQNTQSVQYSCSSSYIMSITSGCVENSYGQIIEMKIKKNVHIKKGLFIALNALEKITISGTQEYITQKNLVEMSTIKSLKEVYFESKTFASSTYNMDVFKSCRRLSKIEISGRDYFPKIF